MEDFIKIIEYLKQEFYKQSFITKQSKDCTVTTIKNPTSNRDIKVEFNSKNEIMTLSFADYYEHYEFTPEDLQTLMETIHNILDG